MSVVGPRYGTTCLRPEAVKWEEALEPDDRDPRIAGEGPCHLIHEARAKYEQNQFGVWLTCRTCAVRLHYAPKKGAPQTTISRGPTPEVVQAVIAQLGNTPGNQIDSNRFRGMIKIEQGRQQAEAKAKAAAKSKTVPGTVPGAVPKARSKAPSMARPSRAPEPPEEDLDSPALDRWNILLRKLFRHLKEVEEMMDM